MADGIWCVDDEVKVCGEGRTTDVVCDRERKRIRMVLGDTPVRLDAGAEAITLQHMLTMGFRLAGWACPVSAAGDMLDAIAIALCETRPADGPAQDQRPREAP